MDNVRLSSYGQTREVWVGVGRGVTQAYSSCQSFSLYLTPCDEKLSLNRRNI